MVTLRSRLSGYYFKSFGVWTADPLDAFGFVSESLARDFARRERVEDVQVHEPEVTALELKLAN